MTFDEQKKRAIDEHHEIEQVEETYGCGYFDAKQAIKISKDKGIGIKEALEEVAKAWRAADFVPKQTIEPIEM